MTEGARAGRTIRRLRLLSGCTQEEVANALLISQSNLRRIEHGQANPTVNMVSAIINYLLSQILGYPVQVSLFQLEDFLQNLILWRYRLIQETQHLAEVGWFPTYGIQAEERRRGRWICVRTLHDVTLDHGVAQRMVEQMNRLQLSPVHLLEAVESMLP